MRPWLYIFFIWKKAPKNAKHEIPREKKNKFLTVFFWWSRGVCGNFSADGMFFCQNGKLFFRALQSIKMVLVAHLKTNTFAPENWCLEDVCLSFWEAWNLLGPKRVRPPKSFATDKSFSLQSRPLDLEGVGWNKPLRLKQWSLRKKKRSNK